MCGPHESKGAEAATESFIWPVSTTEIAFHNTAAVRQFSRILEYRGYMDWGQKLWNHHICIKWFALIM